MPSSEQTILEGLKEIASQHAELFLSFRSYLLEDAESSRRTANNNLKVLCLFSKSIGKKDLLSVTREDVIKFLDSRKKPVEVVTCGKLIDDAVVLKCEESIPLEDSGLILTVQNCIEQPVSHPQEMNTVVGTTKVGEKVFPNIIKTIEAQKEQFICENGSFIKDVVIFTEIFENLNLLPNNPVIMKQFETLTCLKDASTLAVQSCVFSPTIRILP